MAVSKQVKVRVKIKTKNESFNEVLPFGFETVVETNVTDEDQVIPDKVMPQYGIGGKFLREITYSGYTVPKGSYENTTFVGKNGSVYSDRWINYNLGSKSLDEIFEKI